MKSNKYNDFNSQIPGPFSDTRHKTQTNNGTPFTEK